MTRCLPRCRSFRSISWWHRPNEAQSPSISSLPKPKNRPDVLRRPIADVRCARTTSRPSRTSCCSASGCSLYGQFVGSGYGRPPSTRCVRSRPGQIASTTLPPGFSGAFEDTFELLLARVSGRLFQLSVTLRNRPAKADQFRAVLDLSPEEITYEQSKKSILLRCPQLAVRAPAGPRPASPQRRRPRSGAEDLRYCRTGTESSEPCPPTTPWPEQALAVSESAVVVAQERP